MLNSTVDARRTSVLPQATGALSVPIRRPSKILLLRSCRTSIFEQAVRRIRELYPEAEIWGLSQPKFRSEVHACGVEHVLDYPRRWFGFTRIPLSLITRIRRLGFDAVAIPYMGSDDTSYANVHRMAFLFCPSRFLILPADGPARHYHRTEFCKLLLWSTFIGSIRRLDVPLMFLMLLAACLVKRTSPQPRRERSKKRVLHIIGSLGVGGAQTQLAELLACTPQDRYETEILMMARDGEDFSTCRFHRQDIPITYLETWPLLSTSLLEIFLHCRRGRYDVVHTWLFLSNVLGAAGARLARCPRIITSVRSSSLWKRTWYHRPWFRLADVLTARVGDVVTVNAGALVRDHSRWALFPSRAIHVVPNGLDLARVTPASEQTGRSIRKELAFESNCILVGTVGRLAYEKDQVTFLRVIQRLHQQLPSVRGVLVGDGDQRRYLEEFAKNLRLTEVVAFAGQRQDSRSIIADLDLFLLPSIIEGFPNALLEAAFLGIPSLATDVGACRDILVDPRNLFEPGDVETAYLRAKEMLTDQAGSRSSAFAVRDRVQRKFTAERMASCWLSLYEGKAITCSEQP